MLTRGSLFACPAAGIASRVVDEIQKVADACVLPRRIVKLMEAAPRFPSTVTRVFPGAPRFEKIDPVTSGSVEEKTPVISP